MEVGQDKHVADFCCGWKNEMDKREPAADQAAPAAWTDGSQPASSPVLSSGPPHSLSILLLPVCLGDSPHLYGPPRLCSWVMDFLSTPETAFRVGMPDLGAFSGERVPPRTTVLSAALGCFLTSFSWRWPGPYKCPSPTSSPQLNESSQRLLPGEMCPWHWPGRRSSGIPGEWSLCQPEVWDGLSYRVGHSVFHGQLENLTSPPLPPSEGSPLSEDAFWVTASQSVQKVL